MKTQNIKQIILGPRQLTFGFGNNIEKEQNFIVACILQQFENHGQVVLDEFTAHVEQLHGLAEIDTLQYIFWAAHELKIHFRVNGKNIPPYEAKRILVKSPKKHITIVTNKMVEDPLFNDVKSFYKTLSKRKKQNDFEDQYDFAISLLSDLKTWKSNLESLRPLARERFYPGTKKINDHLNLLKTVLTRQDSYSLIHSCYKNKNKIAAMVHDMGIISIFYTRHVKFWELLIQSMEKFHMNFADIKKNPELFSDFNRLTQIFESPSPYHLIAEAGTLLEKVQAGNDIIVQKATDIRRKKAISRVDAMIKKLGKVFDIHNADQDQRNTILYELRSAKKKLTHAKNIHQIDLFIYDTEDLFDDFLVEFQK